MPRTLTIEKKNIEIIRPKRIVAENTKKKVTEYYKNSPKQKKDKIEKKKIKIKDSKKEKTKRNHPPYQLMIKKAIQTLQENPKQVVSGVSILRYIKDKYPVSNLYKRFTKMALRLGVNKGIFIQVKGSFRISAKILKKKKTNEKKKKNNNDSVEKKLTQKKKKDKIDSKKKKKESKKSINKLENQNEENLILNPGVKYIWQYWDEGWRNYDPRASDIVEKVYQDYLNDKGDTDVRAVKSGQWEYMVDFMAMKQTNIQHENHTVRNIRRIKI